MPSSRGLSFVPRPRIDRLAKLPLFFSLRGRRAVVCGDSAAAAWKAELLLAAGARVEVFGERFEPAMIQLSAAPGQSGLQLHQRAPEAGELDGAALLVVEAADEAEAQNWRRLADAAGALCNVIDRPAYSDFDFGSIVNRSPLVIGISTDGIAPTIGQAVRQRIEAVLPEGLGQWLEAARKFRRLIVNRLDRPRRWYFWRRFAEFAFASASMDRPAIPALVVQALNEEVPKGSVALVGAGPGSAEHLTLKALRILQAADVVLYDDLVSAEVLRLARREALRISVGKRAGRPSCRQDDIVARMIELARGGQRVVRLKSGDPGIFARAGEEMAALQKAGIAAQIVPGVSAGLALAARLGVSLTDRRLAHSVRFVTGHDVSGALNKALDWRGLADPQTTLVIYMGARTSQSIERRLLAEGLDSATPVAVAAALDGPGEQVSHGRLGELHRLVEALGEEQPVIIGIGPVFAANAMAARGAERMAL